jgi:demethylmenaquinone methyltransferase/2-methoxy-6-polyprenyl-1,4-benzoquinol methylase
MPFPNHFDHLAPIYDRIISAPDRTQIMEFAELPIGGRLLDVGGGTGRIAQGFVGKAGQIIIADSSLKMLKEAQLKKDLQTVGSAAEALPFPDEYFARVLMVDAFHHLQHQEHSLTELWRVLAPGGLLIIEEPDIHSLAVKLVALVEKLALFRSHFVPAKWIAEQLRALGLHTQVHTAGVTFWVVGRKLRKPKVA